jgi:hypothetical protein
VTDVHGVSATAGSEMECTSFEDLLCMMHGTERQSAETLLTEWVQVQRVGVPLGRISGRKEELETIIEHVECKCLLCYG